MKHTGDDESPFCYIFHPSDKMKNNHAFGRFHMCRTGQSEGNCFKHWNILRSSVVFDCPNRSLWLGLQMVIIRIKI